MQAPEVPRAVVAAMSVASSLDLTVDDAIVLHNSNKLTLRLLPCDVLARVAPVAHQVAQFEVELAQRLAESGCPVAALEPRVAPSVYQRDGYVVTLWTYYEPATPREVSPADYATALERLHAGMRKLNVPAPHFTDRVDQAQQLVASRDHTPALADADRELLADTLRNLKRRIGERGGAEQLLHGEPHPGNVLSTKNGLLFIDLETCCRGPVEFDLAHAPEEVSGHYPGANHHLLRECRILVLAMITTWRWDQGDQLPDGRRLGKEWLSQIRTALERKELNIPADPGISRSRCEGSSTLPTQSGRTPPIIGPLAPLPCPVRPSRPGHPERGSSVSRTAAACAVSGSACGTSSGRRGCWSHGRRISAGACSILRCKSRRL